MKFLKPLLLTSIILFFGACSTKVGDSQGGVDTTTTPETDFCSTSTTYTSFVTVTGTASFYKRGLVVSQSGGAITNVILGAPISTGLPVKYAEVRVLDSSGTVVQCGQTDSSGHLMALDGISALKISNTAGTYTVQVNSRSNHTFPAAGGKAAYKLYASVKKDIYSNEFYTISATVTSTGSGTVNTTLTAYAKESQSAEITGGAFNIYNDILTAYIYVGNHTGTTDVSCLNPKLDVYWKAGFNPAQYMYPSADPSTLSTVSFYVRGDSQLYINGGVQGNVSTQDTDHFDDTVIIHELGHHVEDVCGKMDSPGGTHYGLYRIDPRFAWSEGWGNFFGAHMVGNNISSLNPDLTGQLSGTRWSQYADTQGYTDGAGTHGSSLILLDLTRAGNNPESAGSGRYYDKVNPTLYPGEGHAREVSISRSLFKGTNTCTTYCSNTNLFAEYWKAFENRAGGNGMGRVDHPFRSSSRFYNQLTAYVSSADLTTVDGILDNDEAQQRSGSSSYVVGGHQIWIPYAIPLINNHATPCPNSPRIQPRYEADTVTNGFSDQRYSNHFYLVDLSGLPGITQINLQATQVSGTAVDIDLILYKDGYHFNEDCTTDDTGTCTAWAKDTTSTDMVRADRSNASNLATFTKSITTLNSLSASSYYLLDVRAFTANKTITNTTLYDYTLTNQSGEYLCPSPTY
jgi:hypothetical protein